MSVQVMLMADVKDLGAEGDIVTVADGYARNYLFARNLASTVTPATLRRLEKIRRERDRARQAQVEAARALAAQIEQCSCTLAAKISDGDKLFGSVTAADVVAGLKAQGIDIDERWVELDKPIKQLGVYDVPVKLHAEVSTLVKVWVVEE